MSSRQRPDLSAIDIPRAAKGAAAPTAPADAPPLVPEGQGSGVGERAPAPAAAPVSPSLPVAPPPEPRFPLGARVPRELLERLRNLAFHARIEKQVIIERALDEYLTRHGA